MCNIEILYSLLFQVLTYHCVLTSCQRLLNPEGGMARRGAEPVSRKVGWWWWWVILVGLVQCVTPGQFFFLV